MATLPGLESAGEVKGQLETATEKFISAFKEGKEDNSVADFIYSAMLALAQNVDRQNMRGREISRNMTSLLGYIQELNELYGDADADDAELAELVQDSKA